MNLKENNVNDNFLSDTQQNEYMQLVTEIMQVRAIGDSPKAFIHTYGCQQNVSDSEKIKGMLTLMGYSMTDEKEKADLILFNTCAVREHAQDRVFGNVGALKALKKKNPSLLIALCGCMTEQEHVANKLYKSFPFVGLVFGTHYLHKFPELLYKSLSSGKRVFERGEDDKIIHEGIPVKRDKTFKGFIPIMYGCDNFCSYCIVPYVRGRERSRASKDIINEAMEMVNLGYKEITLLGQNVNSYGKGLDEDITFSKLLQKLDAIEGDYVIRFMTSHPKDCNKDLIDVIANSKHISTHLHLPFQSGSDKVLKDMNRNYTKEKYIDMINYAKSKIENLSLTSDVIVGFPTETHEDFLKTIDLIREVEFSSLFTFIYSRREGTPAQKLENVATDEEKSKWFSSLLKEQEEIASKRSAKMVSKVYKVLAEEETGKNNEISGRTSGNIIIEFEASKDVIGSFVLVEVTKAGNYVLKGKLIEKI